MGYRPQPRPGPQGIPGSSSILGNAAVSNPTTSSNPNDASAATLNVTYDINGIGLTNVGFTDKNGFEIVQRTLAGQNVYGAGTNAKTTYNPLSVTNLCQAAGQKNVLSLEMDSWGMGDSFVMTMNNTYSGGPISGDEGQCFMPVCRLYQQGTLTTCTISSVPTQSSANTTITQTVSGSKTSQTVSVASTAGIAINDWIVVGQEIPSGFINIEAVHVTAVGAGTITGIFTSNHDSGTTVTPALVLILNSGGGLGEQRVLVNLSGISYSTGAINGQNFGSLNGSGTTWTNSMVGGNALNVGAISVNANNYSGAPFSSGSPLKSWYQITTVNSPTNVGICTFSVAGDTSYHAATTGTYIIRPAARILRIIGSIVVCETSTHTWTAGDTLECAICPYPDVSGFQFYLAAYTPGGTYRRALLLNNQGAKKFFAGIEVYGNLDVNPDATDDVSFEYGFTATSVNYGFAVSQTKTAAILLQTASGGHADSDGTILWNSTAACYLKPDSSNFLGLKFRPFMSGSFTAGAINFIDATKSADGFYHADFDDVITSTKYIQPGVFTIGGNPTPPSAANAGFGAIIAVTNGNAGAKCLACSDGTNWKVIALGASISSS